MSASTSSPTRGDTRTYVENRKRVLGATLRLPRNPEDAALALCEQLGGRWIARGWLLAALEEVEAEPKYWTDHHGNRVLL